MAAAQPDVDLLAVDVHTPGLGNLLKLVEAAGLTNVRLVDGDARVVLTRLPTGSLRGIRVFFPDPWPKARHAKRRLVDPTFADLAADRLEDGGALHVATDSLGYAGSVRETLGGHPLLRRSDAVPWRPTTGYEQRALDAGRPSYDIVAVRRPRA